MDRRDFLRSLGGAASALGAAVLPWDVLAAPGPDAPDDWQAAFDAHRGRNPWQLGFDGLQADVAPMALKLGMNEWMDGRTDEWTDGWMEG